VAIGLLALTIMKLPIPDRVRTKLAEKYLDLAERYPNFNWGPARSLRIIREFQRKNAEDTYLRCKAQEGVALDFLYFRLIEIVHLEDFGSLHRSLLQLLPQLSDSPSYQDFSAEFNRRASSLRGSSWQKIGYLFRKKKSFLVGFDAYREMPNLPVEVDFVEVGLHKVLPSIYAVSFDVHLTAAATEHLTQLQDSRYMPIVRFDGIIPLMKLGRAIHLSGHSESPSETEMSRALLTWLEQLRGGVERCISPFIRGHFMKQSGADLARLPTVEVYTLAGVPEDEEAFNKWLQTARFWLDPLGIEDRFDSYGNNDLLFSWSRKDRMVGRWPHRLVVMKDSYSKSLRTEGYGGDERAAIVYGTRYLMDDLTPPIALYEHLRTMERRVEQVRALAVGIMGSSRRLNTFIKRSRDIQREAHLLDRLSMEFKQEGRLFEHRIKSLAALQSKYPGEKKTDLKDDIFKSLEWTMNFLQGQLSYVRASFSEFLALRNMTANYRLQWYVLILSIIATVASIISVIVSWPNIKEFLRDVFGINL
jgi:hypothetical protein